MKTPTKATAPETGKISGYLTNGKTYDIINQYAPINEFGFEFIILSDNGIECYCFEIKCSHLNGLNWRLS